MLGRGLLAENFVVPVSPWDRSRFEVYISTRELLGQIGDRSTLQALIERHCGAITEVKNLLEEPTLGPILNEMGAEALSNQALAALAKALAKKKDQVSLPVPANAA